MNSPRQGQAKGESPVIPEILPKNGLVYSEKASLSEVRFDAAVDLGRQIFVLAPTPRSLPTRLSVSNISY